MRKVIVETVGKCTRTIKVGIDLVEIKKKRERRHIAGLTGLICSPRILAHTGADDETPKSRSWKTTKKGESHAKRGWQRHTDRKPSRRRARWGHHRPWISPSARILNEMGLCIYSNIEGG